MIVTHIFQRYVISFAIISMHFKSSIKNYLNICFIKVCFLIFCYGKFQSYIKGEKNTLMNFIIPSQRLNNHQIQTFFLFYFLIHSACSRLFGSKSKTLYHFICKYFSLQL